MSGVMRGRARQVDTALGVIEQAAAIAIEEVVDVDDDAISGEAIRERLEAALETMEESVATMQEQLERLA